MKIDKEVLARVTEIVKAARKAEPPDETDLETQALVKFPDAKATMNKAILSLALGEDALATLYTVYLYGFEAGATYHVLATQTEAEPTTDNVQPEVKEATAG